MQKTSVVKTNNFSFRKRRLINKFMLFLSFLAVFSGLFWLFWIIGTLFIKGIFDVSWSLLTEITLPTGENGGLSNAILGSLIMVGFGTLIGTPIGILTGTYLAEYSQKSWLVPITRFLNDILLSVPSIIIGLFVYSIYVIRVGHYSGWAGTIALSILIIPIVVKTTDNMLLLVPNSLREAAIALGCPKWKMIIMICYRSAKSGITTGVLLAITRVIGETAPLLFTALSNQFMSYDMNKPMANLPVVIFQFVTSPFPDWNKLAWAGAALITIFVLFVNIITRTFFR